MIKAEDYRNPHSRYSFPEHEDVQERALSELVDAFAAEMKAKLIAKMREGYGGWDDPDVASRIEDSLYRHANRAAGNPAAGVEGDPKQYVDVANLAAMLWNLGRGAPRGDGGER